MKHILSIYVKNEPGVMSSVSGLFTRRAFNIDSIAVGTTEDPAVSSMTIVMNGDDNDLRQFQGQLLKLADVLEVRTLPYHGSVTRELMLVRVDTASSRRPRARLLSVKRNSASGAWLVVEYSSITLRNRNCAANQRPERW